MTGLTRRSLASGAAALAAAGAAAPALSRARTRKDF
jgi:hypothetical protein